MLSASADPQFHSSSTVATAAAASSSTVPAASDNLKRRRSASPPGDDDHEFLDPKRPDIPRWASIIQAPSSEAEPRVMDVVRKAEQILINSSSMDVDSDIAYFDDLYLPLIFRRKHLPHRPVSDFSKLSAKLIFGAESPAILGNRVATVPCLSASSLSVGAEFLARHYPKRTIYIPLQTWGIHEKVFKLAGLCVKTYRYYDQKMRGLHFKAMLKDLGSATGGEVVLLHACGQGVDPTLDQWKQIMKLMTDTGLLPFFDSTYQGLASGNLDSDAMAVRMFVADGGECFVAQSYVENMGLYGDHVDAFSIVCSSAKVALQFESQLKLVIEPMHYSLRGASIVTTILEDSEMCKEWFIELKAMTDRTISIRQQLFDSLSARGTMGDWSHITKQIGMFTFTGLSMQQAALVTKVFHIYITTDGQISMKGLTSETVPLLVDAIHGVVATTETVHHGNDSVLVDSKDTFASNSAEKALQSDQTVLSVNCPQDDLVGLFGIVGLASSSRELSGGTKGSSDRSTELTPPRSYGRPKDTLPPSPRRSPRLRTKQMSPLPRRSPRLRKKLMS